MAAGEVGGLVLDATAPDGTGISDIVMFLQSYFQIPANPANKVGVVLEQQQQGAALDQYEDHILDWYLPGQFSSLFQGEEINYIVAARDGLKAICQWMRAGRWGDVYGDFCRDHGYQGVDDDDDDDDDDEDSVYELDGPPPLAAPAHGAHPAIAGPDGSPGDQALTDTRHGEAGPPADEEHISLFRGASAEMNPITVRGLKWRQAMQKTTGPLSGVVGKSLAGGAIGFAFGACYGLGATLYRDIGHCRAGRITKMQLAANVGHQVALQGCLGGAASGAAAYLSAVLQSGIKGTGIVAGVVMLAELVWHFKDWWLGRITGEEFCKRSRDCVCFSVGGYGGATAGGLAGAAVGACGGPVGALIGGVIGALLGGILGGCAGKWVGSAIISDGFIDERGRTRALKAAYKNLGLDPKSRPTREDLHKARNRVRSKHHPDKHPKASQKERDQHKAAYERAESDYILLMVALGYDIPEEPREPLPIKFFGETEQSDGPTRGLGLVWLTHTRRHPALGQQQPWWAATLLELHSGLPLVHELVRVVGLRTTVGRQLNCKMGIVQRYQVSWRRARRSLRVVVSIRDGTVTKEVAVRPQNLELPWVAVTQTEALRRNRIMVERTADLWEAQAHMLATQHLERRRAALAVAVDSVCMLERRQVAVQEAGERYLLLLGFSSAASIAPPPTAWTARWPPTPHWNVCLLERGDSPPATEQDSVSEWAVPFVQGLIDDSNATCAHCDWTQRWRMVVRDVRPYRGATAECSMHGYCCRRQDYARRGEHRAEVVPSLPAQLIDSPLTEYLLFHGTRAADAIAGDIHGVDPRCASLRRPGMYGDGGYGTCQACKAHQYSEAGNSTRPSGSGPTRGTLFLIRFTPARQYRTERSMCHERRPPDGHDTVAVRSGTEVARTRDRIHVQLHNEFVCFETKGSHIEFIIDYEVVPRTPPEP
eukprot:TRINITY_DN55233_c0_g1_i1.p1 TRINITY_DN55233_c0_g1~~TRINITY_DN55233_c0_g1_i1.p1  ORF type:complete len:937 (+),score=189.82 TRINITY_DN55233_c0_g1_i1:120-2930(+)